jgi:hypothetical protein
VGKGMRYSALLGFFWIVGLSVLLSGCGGGGGTKPPVPVIQNLNSSTSPSSPVSLPIEIDGTGFQSAPGQVIFTQGSITATVTPSAGGWSDSGIVAVVPSGNGTSQFTVPGTVAVSVKTTGGTSNSVNLALVQTFSFNVNNITWTTTTALPTAMSGMRAVAVPGAGSPPTSAFVIVTGGFDGTKNSTTVLADTINADGTLGASWGAIATSALPFPRADHAMVEADPGNSLVPAGSRYVYVLGGQQTSTDTPGGTNTVFMASVDPTTGAVGAWTQLTSNLPASLVGPGAALFNDHIYVVGGLQTSGIPSSAVYSAPINSDGTLGTWTTSTNPYPVTVAFPTVLGFAGNIYVINGDDQNETSPNVADLGGITDARFASAHFGVVGPWTSTSSTIKNRAKQVTWLEFGQIIDAEGTYNGGATGSTELERTTVQSDGTLATWNGVTAVNAPNANVYNAAAIVSPLLTSNNVPRFLLFGGQQYVQSGTSSILVNLLSATVYYNNAP